MLQNWIDMLFALPAPVRIIGTLLLVAAGIWGGVRAVRAAGREPEGETQQLRQLRHLVRALRWALIGGSAALLGTGLVRDDETLVGLGIIIGLEELYETTMVLAVLRMGLRIERKEALAAGLRP